ncbi:uncharacterized protein [Spinacia oleracea]|uniref:Uncharacterized protein n=1 Tax=Spinacia oleracea TaxID=3562 RepID=A0ABM3RIN1_SPIOL|nr:uncharacterized protein LOC130469955 [Spinacia oleracea]
MPYKIYERLNLGDLSPTSMSLQLADRSVMYPLSRVEDVPLVIGKLTFLVDFLVLDIDEDAHTPIILGRPFLAAKGALIDVQGGLITLKVGGTMASFKLPQGEGYFSNMSSCMKVDTIACIVANPSNDFYVSKCGIELDVTTIPEIFGVKLDDGVKATPSKVMHKPGKKAKKAKRATEKFSGGWLGCVTMCGGVDKVFVPKGAKESFLTSDDPKQSAYDPP